MRFSVVIVVIVVTLSWSNVLIAESQLTLLDVPTLVVDPNSKTATALLQLKNTTGKAVTIALSARDFESLTTGDKLGTTIRFSTPDGPERKTVYVYDEEEERLPPDEILSVRVHVSGLWEAGESESELLNNGVRIATLTALFYRPPFSVKPLFKNPEQPELSFEAGKSSTLLLKNDDPMTYQLHWELIVEGIPSTGDSPVTVGPNSTSPPITIAPPDGWFTSCVSGLFKEDIRNGFLTLGFQPPGSTGSPNWPTKTISVKVRLSYFSENVRELFGFSIILMVLSLGAICSLLLSIWVPNQRQRMDLKEQLEKLGDNIRLSKIDPGLKLSMRVDRKQILTRLYSRWVFIPDISTVFTECRQSIATLKKRFELAKRVAGTYKDVESHYYARVPFSLIEEVEKKLQRAIAELSKKIEPNEPCLEKAQLFITEASSQMEKFNNPDEEFARKLVDLMANLSINMHEAKSDTVLKEGYAKFKIELKEVFAFEEEMTEIMKKGLPGITPEKYWWIDMKISKFHIILHYLHHSKNFAGARLDKLEKHGKELVKLLGKRDLHSLRSAWLLEKQMEAGVYTKDLEDAIERKEIFVEMNPGIATADRPVQLTARFKDEKLDRCVSRDKLKCIWEFDHNVSDEEGWEITHYFPNPKKGWEITHYFPNPKSGEHKYKVRVWFKNVDGQEIKSDGEKVVIEENVPVKTEKVIESKDRLKVEVVRFAIVLFATLLGLVAGAREQILKLDFIPGLIAVFLIGFGADTVKNILTQHQQTDQ
jgi:hypothetical protein